MLRRVLGLLSAALAIVCSAPSAGAESIAPGTVVDSGPAASVVELASASVQRITYRSAGPNGESMLSSGVLYLPRGAAPPGGWPVLAWAHGTVGVGDRCAPSAVPIPDPVREGLERWVQAGHAVVVSDYVGLGTPGVHPYLSGRAAAQSVIDGVRAARELVPELGRRWAVAGHSQGGSAALFVAHMARQYAPELDYRGAVAIAPASNLENLLVLAGPALPPLPTIGTTVYLAYLLAAVRAYEPRLDVDSVLTPLGHDVVSRLSDTCFEEANAAVGDLSIGQLVNRPLSDTPIAGVLRDWMTVPTSGYDRPIMIAQGTVDIVVPLPLTTKLVDDMAAAGTRVDLRVFPRGHTFTVVDSVPVTTPFLQDLLR